MRKVKTYKGHDIFEDGEFWIVKGPVIDDKLPWGFFPFLKDVEGFIDDLIEEAGK